MIAQSITSSHRLIAIVMILGSTIVFASAVPADSTDSTIDQAQQSTEMLKPKPGGRRGGAGFNLKK